MAKTQERGIRVARAGTWSLEAGRFRITAAIPAPVIRGRALPPMLFSKALPGRRIAIGGISGRVRGATSAAGGVKLSWESFLSDDARLAGIRLSLANVGKEPLRLESLTPLDAKGDGAITVAEASFRDWRCLRMARQKNDIPGAFRPAVRDDNLDDALFDSSYVSAGSGISAGDGKAGPAEKILVADSCLLIHSDRDEEAPGLFLGVFGQTEHLSQFRITPSPDWQELERLEVRCEFDGVLLEAGESRTTHWLLIRSVEDEALALRDFAEMAAREINLPHPPKPPAVYCSWYFYGPNLTQEDVDENLEQLKRRRTPFDVFVIDSGWFDTSGTWEANDLWPLGMKHAASRLRAAGFQPGIWTSPFVVATDSPILKKYPDLVGRNEQGEPMIFAMEGTSSYVVDPTAPSARQYFTEMFQKIKSWGFTHHKFDFLRAVPNAVGILFHDRKATRAQAYRRGMEILREALGSDSYILSCGGLYEAGLGLVDAQRSGCDVWGSWRRSNYKQDRPSVMVAIKQNVMRSHMNRLWHTDPDALMIRLRDEAWGGVGKRSELSLGDCTEEEAFTLAVNQYLGGGMVCACERFAELQESRWALLRHILPAAVPPALPLNLGAPNCPDLFLTRVEPPCASMDPWWTFVVCNWNNSPQTREIRLPAGRLQGAGAKLAVFEFREQKFIGLHPPDAVLKADLPAHGSRVFRLTPWRGDRPAILGTDLHLSGGCELRDVVAEAERVRGAIESNGQYPVVVTVGFPDGVGCRVVRARVAAGARRFEARMQSD